MTAPPGCLATRATLLETEVALVVTLALTAGAVVSFAFQPPAEPIDPGVTEPRAEFVTGEVKLILRPVPAERTYGCR